MPTYQYECKACGHTFEIFQGMNDKKLRKCPKCHKPKLSRLIGTGGGIIFKGSGFYETDYKRTAASGQSSKKSDTPQQSDKQQPKKQENCCGSCQCSS